VYRHWLQEKGGEGMHTLPRVVNVMRAATPWGVEREEEMVGGESTHAHLREGGGDSRLRRALTYIVGVERQEGVMHSRAVVTRVMRGSRFCGGRAE
jgi:hypothetical protein